MGHFYWPKLHQDVAAFCRSCHPCPVVGKPKQKVPVAPLTSVPVVGEPFSKVVIDCAGPLPKTKKGNEFLLIIMDITRFPEAVPLRNIKARTIIEELVFFFLFSPRVVLYSNMCLSLRTTTWGFRQGKIS